MLMKLNEEVAETLLQYIAPEIGDGFYTTQMRAYAGKPIETLLPKILKAARKQEELFDEVKTTIKMLKNITDSMQVEQGQLLVSFFCDSYCQRDKKVHTRVVDDTLEPEFSDSPLNVDYQFDFLEGKPLRELLKKDGIKGECLFYRTHKSQASEPQVTCDACHGTGETTCPSCNGSGREQYVAGYYASGEERIKTGMCSVCQGRGRISCPDCQGEGTIEIFVSDYSVEKSVEETVFQKTGIAYASPWMYGHKLNENYGEREDSFWNTSFIRDYLADEIQDAVWGDENISLKMKNCKEIAEDRTGMIEEEFKQLGLLKEYQQNRNSIKKGKGFMCRHECHYAIPITRFHLITRRIFKQEDVPYDFYIIHVGSKTNQILIPMNMESTGKFEYFITKLLKKSEL